MDTYIEKYLEYLKIQKNYSINTIEGYKEDIEFFKEFLDKNSYNFLEVEYKDIRQFFNYINT